MAHGTDDDGLGDGYNDASLAPFCAVGTRPIAADRRARERRISYPMQEGQ